MDISVTGSGAGEDLDITTVGATTEMRLTSASTGADAIKLSTDGGIQAWVAEEKTLELGNAGQDTYLRICLLQTSPRPRASEHAPKPGTA